MQLIGLQAVVLVLLGQQGMARDRATFFSPRCTGEPDSLPSGRATAAEYSAYWLVATKHHIGQVEIHFDV
jgi:hypothetical protein